MINKGVFMVKTNFTKVEEALVEGLRKITVKHLLDLADMASSLEKRPKINTLEPPAAPETKEDLQLREARMQLITSLNRDLKALSKHDVNTYKELGFKRNDLKKFLEHPDALSPEEWDKIKSIKEQVSTFKKELMKTLPNSSDDDIVNAERKKHVNKRFNINEKWLPLK